MEKIDYHIREELEPYINCIMVGESKALDAHLNIPLYADGYPGIMFQQTTQGFYLLPKGKKLSEFYLYGQTLQPISLDVKGPYRYVVIQLYPFASKYLLNIDPKVLNDECFDLLQLHHIATKEYFSRIQAARDLETKVDIILDFIKALIVTNQVREDDKIQQAINLILQKKGKIKIKDILSSLYITERTLERNFKAQVGLSPKQFAKIIQFQFSLSQLTQSKFDKLVDIGYDSGFTDQSHFIRAFKKYTGQTPSYYLKSIEE